MLKKSSNFYIRFFAIALPIMLQAVTTTIISLVDNIMVGQLGAVAIAAVSVSNRFLVIFSFVIWGIIAAAGIFVAQYYGSKKEEEMKQSFRFSLLATYGFALPVMIFILFFNKQIASFFVHDQEIIIEIQKYLFIMTIGFIPFVATQNINGALRSIGEVKIPLIATILGVITNTILNYILIFGNFNAPALGVAGAAIATVIARFVEFSFVWSCYHFGTYGFKTKLSDIFKVEKDRAVMIFKKALPLVINEFAYGVGLALLLKLYGTRGADALAAYGIAGTATDIFYSATQGIMVATTVLVGHELGANHLEEARKNGYRIIKVTFAMGIFFSCLLVVCAPVFPMIYNLSSTITPEVLETTKIMIYIIAYALWAQETALACYVLLRVGGDMKSTLFLDGVYMWVVNILTVTILAYFTDFNVFVLMFAGQTTDLLKMIFAFILVRKEKWLVNLAKN